MKKDVSDCTELGTPRAAVINTSNRTEMNHLLAPVDGCDKINNTLTPVLGSILFRTDSFLASEMTFVFDNFDYVFVMIR
jgi:hypothetical protein